MIKREVVVAYIVSADGKHLLGRKRPTPQGMQQDKWHHPGGKLEEGESKEEGLRREVLEETGLDIKALGAKISLILDEGLREIVEKVNEETGEKEEMEYVFTTFLVEMPQKAAKLGAEANENEDLMNLRWIEMEEVMNYKMVPVAELTLKKLGWWREPIEIEDFAKVEMRVGLVVEASEPEWSNKLIRQVVNFGEGMGQRVIFSGLRKWYSAAEDFVGRKLVYVTNLAPRKMGEEVSEGMILAVEDSEGVPIRWDLTETEIAPGTRVG